MPAENEISPDGIPAGEVAPVVETGGAVTTETTTETQAAAEPEVSFEDFASLKDQPLMSKAGDKKPEEKKEEEVKVEGEVKTDDKAGEQPPKEGKESEPNKAGQPLATASKKGVVARDYSGLPENMVPLFKTMGNQAFDALKPFYMEAVKAQAELAEFKKNPPVADKNAIPASYYEHPEAYTLTPEYSAAANAAQESQLVLEHWRSQLDAVRNGATEYQTLARDPQTKQLVYGQNQKVDQRTQSYIENIFFNANNQAGTYQQKLAAVRAEYTSKHTALVNDIRGWEKKFFDVFENEKHPLVPAYKDTLAKFPAGVQNNVLAAPLAKALTSLTALINIVTELKKTGGKVEPTTEEKKVAAQKKAGPTSGGASGAEETNGKDDVTLDDFNKVKES